MVERVGRTPLCMEAGVFLFTLASQQENHKSSKTSGVGCISNIIEVR